MIKDKADGQTAGSGRSPSGATTGAAPSGGASSPMGPGRGERPAAAAGLPNC
jgi:hypothetical protein